MNSSPALLFMVAYFNLLKYILMYFLRLEFSTRSANWFLGDCSRYERMRSYLTGITFEELFSDIEHP